MDIKLTKTEQSILKNAGVEALILFGSHAQGKAGPMSDYDFGVLLQNPKNYHNPKKRKEVYDILYNLLSSKIKKLVDIDIVFLPTAPMELQSHVSKYGIPIYEHNTRAFVRFREHVMKLYSDFAPIRNMFHSAILSRIP